MSGRVKAVVRVRPPFKTEVVVPGYSNVVRTVSSDQGQKVIVAFPVCIEFNLFIMKFI